MSEASVRETEDVLKEAIQFVKVTTVNGYLTDISVAMILVQMKRDGIVFSLSNDS